MNVIGTDCFLNKIKRNDGVGVGFLVAISRKQITTSFTLSYTFLCTTMETKRTNEKKGFFRSFANLKLEYRL